MPIGQFVTRADGWRHITDGVEFFGTVEFDVDGRSQRMNVIQRYLAFASRMHSGWERQMIVEGANPADELQLRIIPPNSLDGTTWSEDRRQAAFASGAPTIPLSSRNLMDLSGSQSARNAVASPVCPERQAGPNLSAQC